MPLVSIDFHRILGKIRPMHAVGQPPFGTGIRKLDFSPMQLLREAHIPYSRLHDVGGDFGGNRYVDIPNIFRDFDADETDPASYDFAFTDALLAGMAEHGISPIFRLGVTIENQCAIKAYRIYPPKDFAKWARICEHIIRHYNEGWADGFHYGIVYFEIWNEPENGHVKEENQMWQGTPEEYFRLYDVTARHLKACFGNTIKVGGYAATNNCGFFYHPERYGITRTPRPIDEKYERYMYRLRFLEGFLSYIREKKSPIDFFSWHSYEDVEDTLLMDEGIHKMLEKYGYEGIERQCNEWNNAALVADSHGTAFAAAAAASMMITMQSSHTDMLCYYDAKLTASTYGGFFKPLSSIPTPTYYAFRAFGALYALGNEVACESDTKEVYALAATGEGGNAILVVNRTGKAQTVSTNAQGLTVHLLNEREMLTPTDLDSTCFMLGENEVALLSL